MCQERNPHKHAELIKAWADGAEIQVQTADGNWKTLQSPQWTSLNTYRIKPKEPIVRYACASYIDYDAHSAKESLHNFEETKTHWTKDSCCTDNIKATFCPDTGKLLSVEMI